MSNSSRKVKNPLLSAAGPGFSLENYTENAFLVPVTPATSTVLRDDAELDNFVGQEPTNNNQPQTLSETYEQHPSANESCQPNENNDTGNQSMRQRYISSILSSLPNLSLPSSKADSTRTQESQVSENISGATQESIPFVFSQGRHGSPSDVPGSLTTTLQNISSTDPSGFPGGTLPSPPPSTVPPSASAVAPNSYRLGNQRRLKYVPPPDLTSNNLKAYPEVQAVFPSQNAYATPSSILNPYETEQSPQTKNINEQQFSSPTEQISTSEQLSRNSSLHSSFRSSPVAIGSAYNSPQTFANQATSYDNSSVPASLQFVSSPAKPIPSRLLEPATPQNTPANVSFPNYVPYLNRDLPSANCDKEVARAFKSPNQLNSPPKSTKFTKDGILGATIEPASKPSLTSEETVAKFVPILAAQVTEKLKHILEEREKGSHHEIFPEPSSEIDEATTNVAAELAKSCVLQSETPQPAKLQDFNEKPYEARSNDIQEKIVRPTSNILSDVFLGEKSTVLSVTRPETHKANNAVVTDTQAVQSNVHLPEYHSQVQTIPASHPILQRTQLSADQESTRIPFAQSAQNVSHVPPKLTESSASVYFESITKSTDRFLNSSFQENNWKPPLAQAVVDGTNPQQAQEIPALNPAETDPTINASSWYANQSSQSQVLNTASNNQSTSIRTNQPPPPAFYNPADFAGNQVLQQPTFPHTQPAQQRKIQSAREHLYESVGGFHQFSAVHQNNAAYPLPPLSTTTVPELTGSATLSPVQMSTNPLSNRSVQDTIPQSFQNLASGSPEQRVQYRPVYHHWFYRKEVESKVLWHPFSMQDSLKLEEVHNSSEITTETTVATDGGRYDVSIMRRERAPAYWTGAPNEVRRCSWFCMGPIESKYVPYDEKTATKLEEEYKLACVTNDWNRRIELANGEYILFHSATVQVHYVHPNSSELSGSWGNSTGSASRQKVVKRGVSEFNIDEGEPEKVDHLLFLVHGIGSVCDLKFRTVEEVVDEFRSITLQLVQSHYRTASTQGIVNKIEVLPISWHATLHSGDTGIDKKLQAITLESIPKLRHFTNDTLLDILFYTSPVYCQTIMHTVGSEMNRLHALFKERNPTFDGDVYIGGHSLGSLILFDLLCHQKPIVKSEKEDDDNDDSSDKGENEYGAVKPMPAHVLKRRLSKRISYVMGAAGTGQPFIHYPQLNFHPGAFFALGSPIGMFVTVRGIETLGEEFVLPTCPAFFNIFHPFDPVAYRVESLINPAASKYRPMLIPHHKGRKRMHLELKETMARVGADLKQKVLDSVKSTWNSIFQLSMFYKPDNQALESEIDKVVEEQLQQSQSEMEQRISDDGSANIMIGKLNGGRRIDYVLQEAPFEYINEYIFALTSHICYWESEDTMLMMLKEMYGSKGIQTDAKLPQQTMSIERVSPSSFTNLGAFLPSGSNAGTSSTFAPPTFETITEVDPTAPISNKPVGPPPKTGFVPKS